MGREVIIMPKEINFTLFDCAGGKKIRINRSVLPALEDFKRFVEKIFEEVEKKEYGTLNVSVFDLSDAEDVTIE